MRGAPRILIIFFLCAGSSIAYGLPLGPDASESQQMLSCKDMLRAYQSHFAEKCSSSGGQSPCSKRCESQEAPRKATCRQECIVDCEDLEKQIASKQGQCGKPSWQQ